MAQQTVTESNIVAKEGTPVVSRLIGGVSLLAGLVLLYLGFDVYPIITEWTFEPFGFSRELLSIFSGVSVVFIGVGYFLIRADPLGWWGGFILAGVTLIGSLLAVFVTGNPLFAAGAVVAVLVGGVLLYEQRAFGVSVL